jgi:hypothetical protein
LSKEDRKAIGEDIKTVEIGWPIGMPACKATGDGLFDVRTVLDQPLHEWGCMTDKFDHTGSSFDSFLEEEGLREEVEATATKRVLAWEFCQAMRRQSKSKMALAREMGTSRTQVDRLLDPATTGVSLDTIARAAGALGKRISVRLLDSPAKRRPKAVA